MRSLGAEHGLGACRGAERNGALGTALAATSQNSPYGLLNIDGLLDHCAPRPPQDSSTGLDLQCGGLTARAGFPARLRPLPGRGDESGRRTESTD
jgi:hypothetical protein